MSEHKDVSRRGFMARSVAAAAAVGVGANAASADDEKPVHEDNRGMPCGRLGKAKISRLMIGGNLLSGYMHCRDLKYVNRLFREYATREKIMEALRLAEEGGVNTVFETGGEYVEEYNTRMKGKMQFIPHIRPAESPEAIEEMVKRNIDIGSVAHYMWGLQSDLLVRDGKVDQLKRAVEIAKKYDLPVGVGSHSIQVPMACEKHDIPCDYYVKTLHTDDYPSALPPEQQTDFMWSAGSENPHWYDNQWCIDAPGIIDFFQMVEKPWIAFKVLAAGAIRPREGMTHAFEGGADFVPIGMFDFQVEENCDLAKRIIRRADGNRKRPWRA